MINSAAQFVFADLNTGTLIAGTVFTVINNTSSSAITGNLANGSTFTSTGGTTFSKRAILAAPAMTSPSQSCHSTAFQSG